MTYSFENNPLQAPDDAYEKMIDDLTIVEELVALYGETYRVVITDALRWLAENEPRWKLDRPTDRSAFIRDIMSHVVQPHRKQRNDHT